MDVHVPDHISVFDLRHHYFNVIWYLMKSFHCLRKMQERYTVRELYILQMVKAMYL